MGTLKELKCTKRDIFGFCIDDHAPIWRHAKGTHGKIAGGGGGDYPVKPGGGGGGGGGSNNHPGGHGHEEPGYASGVSKEFFPADDFVTGRRLAGTRTRAARVMPEEHRQVLNNEEILHAKLLNAARMHEGVQEGNPQEYLDEEGLGSWKYKPDVSLHDEANRKGAVFHNAEENKVRLVYPGTSNAQDVLEDAKIAMGSLPEGMDTITETAANRAAAALPETGIEMMDAGAREAVRAGVRAAAAPARAVVEGVGRVAGAASPSFRESEAMQDAHLMGVRASAAFPDAEFATVGHSLGGAKAHHVAADFREYNYQENSAGAIEAHLYNPAIGADIMADHASGRVPSKTTVVQTEGDILTDKVYQPIDRLVDAARVAGDTDRIRVKKVAALEQNASATGIGEHGSDNFYNSGRRVGDPVESRLGKAYTSKQKLHDMRMLQDASRAHDEGIGFEEYYNNHSSDASRERARHLWEASQDAGDELRLGGASEMESAPFLRNQPREQMSNAEYNNWHETNLTNPERIYKRMQRPAPARTTTEPDLSRPPAASIEETKEAEPRERLGRNALAELLETPTEDGARAARANRPLFPEPSTDPELSGQREEALARMRQQPAVDLEPAQPISRGEAVDHINVDADELERRHLAPGEKTLAEHKANPEPTMTPEEIQQFAGTSTEGERRNLIASHASEHEQDLGDFAEAHSGQLTAEKSTFQRASGMTGGEAVGQVGLGLALGGATSLITDALMKKPSAEEYAKMTNKQRRDFEIQHEAAQGTVGGALQRGVGASLGGASGLAAAPEIAAATVASVVGSEVGKGTTEGLESIGVNKYVAETAGSLTGGGAGGAAFVGSGRALQAGGKAVKQGYQALKTATKSAAEATEETAALLEPAAAAETAAEAVETAEGFAGFVEALGVGAEGAEGLAAATAGETGGLSIPIALVGGAIIGGASYGVHKAYDALADTKFGHTVGGAVTDVGKGIADSVVGDVGKGIGKGVSSAYGAVADTGVGQAVGSVATGAVGLAGKGISAATEGVEDAGKAVGKALAFWNW
jgi:hypothetical protein